MLDFNKLAQQIESVSADSLVDTMSQQDIVDAALAAFQQAAGAREGLLERLSTNQPFVLWPIAIPLETFGATFEIAPSNEPVTVIAVDGSQIMPSHHEVHSCYLLNVGLAMVTYGSKFPALLESVPRLYHRPEDLYPLVDRRRMHIDELYVSLERTMLELQCLLDKSIEAASRKTPVVALFDGSLIAWSAEKLPDGYQQAYMHRLQQLFEAFRTNEIPIVGYLSHSRGSDVINDLRAFICPYELADCRQHCGHLNEEDFPCSRIWPLSDRQMFKHMLALNERSCAFQSGASVSKNMDGQDRICFAYLNVGQEVARVEFPRWMLDKREKFDFSLSTIISQVHKGMGYPVCLAEAHHLAVIRGQDRERFFELITRRLVELGANRVRVSPKESKKRIGFV
jgi:hypothetical protein